MRFWGLRRNKLFITYDWKRPIAKQKHKDNIIENIEDDLDIKDDFYKIDFIDEIPNREEIKEVI